MTQKETGIEGKAENTNKMGVLKYDQNWKRIYSFIEWMIVLWRESPVQSEASFHPPSVSVSCQMLTSVESISFNPSWHTCRENFSMLLPTCFLEAMVKKLFKNCCVNWIWGRVEDADFSFSVLVCILYWDYTICKNPDFFSSVSGEWARGKCFFWIFLNTQDVWLKHYI